MGGIIGGGSVVSRWGTRGEGIFEGANGSGSGRTVRILGEGSGFRVQGSGSEERGQGLGSRVSGLKIGTRAVEIPGGRGSHGSFPSCTWERHCLKAVLCFYCPRVLAERGLARALARVPRRAVTCLRRNPWWGGAADLGGRQGEAQLRRQVRSQVQLGNETGTPIRETGLSIAFADGLAHGLVS
jgi:hypothetical protein